MASGETVANSWPGAIGIEFPCGVQTSKKWLQSISSGGVLGSAIAGSVATGEIGGG